VSRPTDPCLTSDRPGLSVPSYRIRPTASIGRNSKRASSCRSEARQSSCWSAPRFSGQKPREPSGTEVLQTDHHRKAIQHDAVGEWLVPYCGGGGGANKAEAQAYNTLRPAYSDLEI
jgi:hypothetical protein